MQITHPKNSRQLIRLLRQVAAGLVRLSLERGFSSMHAQSGRTTARAIQRIKNHPGKYNVKLSAMWKGN